MFGITIHAFRIAGGLLLFYIAFEMVFEKRQERHEKSARRAATEEVIRSLAVFPLAIPLIAGPGAISATILLSDRFSDALGYYRRASSGERNEAYEEARDRMNAFVDRARIR